MSGSHQVSAGLKLALCQMECYNLILVFKLSNPTQEPIIRSVQLPCYAYVTVFLQTAGLFLGLFYRGTGQFRSPWARIGKSKNGLHHHFFRSKIKSVLAVGHWGSKQVWIRGKFKLKIHRSAKTPWQEYRIVTRSQWWAPAQCNYHSSFWSEHNYVKICCLTLTNSA